MAWPSTTKEVDKEICNSRAQNLEAQAEAAALRSRQADVCIRADAAKLPVVLTDCLTYLDRQCEAMHEDIEMIQTTRSARCKTFNSTDADPVTPGNDPKTFQALHRGESSSLKQKCRHCKHLSRQAPPKRYQGSVC
jgi:hypothetical protein